MPCYHRFLGFHQPNTLFPDWDIHHLFVGTFNPAWDFVGRENAPYFYGRTRNNYFWDLLPALWGSLPLRCASFGEWIAFLRKHRIGLTDLIYAIQDADLKDKRHVGWLAGKADINLLRFKKIVWNTEAIISTIFRQCKQLQSLFITNQRTPMLMEQEIQQVAHACSACSIPFGRLITPSGNARFRFPKGSKLYPALLQAWRDSMSTLGVKTL